VIVCISLPMSMLQLLLVEDS